MILFSIQGRKSGEYNRLISSNSIVSRGTIMTAILQTLGPVATCRTIRANWKFLKSATRQQFLSAAKELERLGYGAVVNLSQNVFIKKPPHEVREALHANPEICEEDLYAIRYIKAPSKVVSEHLRLQLIKMGYITLSQLT